MRSTGATTYAPWYLSTLASAYAQLGMFGDARRCIDEASAAMQSSQERWCESDVHRIAGEITLMSPEPDRAAAEMHLDHALAVARQQQARSWERRAAMVMATRGEDSKARWLDRAAITLSGLCLIHCMATALILALATSTTRLASASWRGISSPPSVTP